MAAPVASGSAAIVLSGGGARGAYEVGVLRYLREAVPGGAEFAPEVLCGTSVGAIHASFLAATADRPADQCRDLAGIWESLRFDECFHVGLGQLLSAWQRMSRPPGGLVDAVPFERIVRERTPWSRLRAARVA